MEKLNWHIARELSYRADVRVIAPVGAQAMAPPNVKVVEVPLRPLWRFLAGSHWHAIREAYTWKPDVILAGSGLMALPVLISARISGAHAVTYIHGLDLIAKHPIYQAIWLPALRRMQKLLVNSHATAELAAGIGISRDRIRVVHPGVDLPDLSHREGEVENFRSDYKLGSGPVLLSVGRLSERKGLLEFIEKVLPRVVARFPAVMLAVVGAVPMDALNARAQSPLCLHAAAVKAGVGNNVRVVGRLSDAELTDAYRAANIHVFPVREIPGDIEGFGMVAIEAAAHGLPTVAFAVGGVPDAVSDGQSGRLVPSDDYDQMADSIIELLSSGSEVMRSSARAFAGKFAWKIFGDRLAGELLGPLLSNEPHKWPR